MFSVSFESFFAFYFEFSQPIFNIIGSLNLYSILFPESMSNFFHHLQKCIPEKKIEIFDKKDLLFSTLPYYSLAIVTVLGYRILWDHPWLLVTLLYGLLPLMDEIFLKDNVNPTEQQRKKLQEKDLSFRMCLYVTLIIDWLVFLKVMHHISSYQIKFENLFNLAGVIFVYTNLSATQFALAHQIYHKAGFAAKFIGIFHMSKNLYCHFAYQHLYGHHKNVATPGDPSSAPLYMHNYNFFVKSFLGSLKSVYKMEKQVQNKRIYQNYAVLSILWAFVFTTIIFCVFGAQSGCIFLIQAFLSIFLAQTINYIQHYGLQRNKLENGQYEKVTIQHSWNASHRFTNYLLFKLQRHSDHHQNSMKPYQTLLSISQSPQLPHGYTLMVSMALFPKVWFKVMNPLALQYKKVKNGEIRTELTQLAIYESKIFGMKIAFASVCFFVLECLF